MYECVTHVDDDRCVYSVVNFCLGKLPRGTFYFVDGKRTSDGSWVWGSTRKTIENTHWDSNEPGSKFGEDCIVMGVDGKWSATSCLSPYPALCQYPYKIYT